MRDSIENLPLALVGGQDDKTLDGERVTPARGTLLADQPKLEYEILSNGDLMLTQEDDLGNEDARILIRRDCLLAFVDRLTDAIGIPGVR